MIDLHRLLEDPTYKAFFKTPPKLPPVAKDPALSPCYWVYAQRESHGPWRRGEARSYKEAFGKVRERLSTHHDLVIVSKRVALPPPQRIVRVTRRGKPVMVQTGRGKMEQQTKVVVWSWLKLLDEMDRPHDWCSYCRRPTEFRYFPKHHAFRNGPPDPTKRRCTICGVGLEFARSIVK